MQIYYETGIRRKGHNTQKIEEKDNQLKKKHKLNNGKIFFTGTWRDKTFKMDSYQKAKKWGDKITQCYQKNYL